jgi:hypothetical protein
MLNNKSVVFLNQASFSVKVQAWLDCFVAAVKQVSLHGEDSLFLVLLHLLHCFVDIVFDPGEVLLSWVAKREDV